jgi:hypothetical protein
MSGGPRLLQHGAAIGETGRNAVTLSGGLRVAGREFADGGQLEAWQALQPTELLPRHPGSAGICLDDPSRISR